MIPEFDRSWAAATKNLTDPLRWRKPSTARLMGDLFHEDCPDEWIDKVFAVMALTPQHIFQVLTKRADRMRAYMDRGPKFASPELLTWPLANVWLGVSTERQQEADERIPHLLQTPAAVRFISAEPLLGPITLNPGTRGIILRNYLSTFGGLDWVIVGGESGNNARPFNLEWADAIVDQCRDAAVPCFVKQLGSAPMSSGYPHPLKSRKGGDPAEWPDRLNVRAMPKVTACS